MSLARTDKATRIIAEVLVEALPQCVMQAIIYVSVSNHVKAGTASSVDMELFLAKNGAFVSLMPKSILISSLTMLKTWYELVQEARQAGISVAKKGMQLWAVGHGLPLDAIKRSSIFAWKCQYEISDQEVVSLVDALSKNKSIIRLDLSLAGFEWLPPVKREERSAISTLLQVMNKEGKALEALETLLIRDRAVSQGLWNGMSQAIAGIGRTDTEEDLQKIFLEIGELRAWVELPSRMGDACFLAFSSPPCRLGPSQAYAQFDPCWHDLPIFVCSHR